MALFPKTYHDWEQNRSGLDGLDDPEKSETSNLESSKQMDFPDWDMADVDGVGLVLHGHKQEQSSLIQLNSSESRDTHVEENSVEHWHGDLPEDVGGQDRETDDQESDDSGDALFADSDELGDFSWSFALRFDLQRIDVIDGQHCSGDVNWQTEESDHQDGN